MHVFFEVECRSLRLLFGMVIPLYHLLDVWSANYSFRPAHFTIKIPGTGRCPSLSAGLIVSLPLISMQLLPPPFRFRASWHPISLRIFATSRRLAPSAVPGLFPC